jgi:hypothetical protein
VKPGFALEREGPPVRVTSKQRTLAIREYFKQEFTVIRSA